MTLENGQLHPQILCLLSTFWWPGGGPGQAETGKEERQQPNLRTPSVWTRFSSLVWVCVQNR